MPRNWSKAVPEGNGPVPHQTKFGSAQSTIANLYQLIKELSNRSDSNFDRMRSHFDQQDEKLDGCMEKARKTKQRLASLEQNARQLRLATEADVPTYKKTRRRAEDAAADQAKHGDSCSAKRVHAGPTGSTSFGRTAKPPALPRRNNILVDRGAEAPKPHLSHVEVRMLPSTAGSLLPAGTASTAIRIIFPR